MIKTLLWTVSNISIWSGPIHYDKALFTFQHFAVAGIFYVLILAGSSSFVKLKMWKVCEV